MSGTAKGAQKAVAAVKDKYGADHYQRIGGKGGKATGVAKGFGAGEAGRERARLAGTIYGTKGKRGPAKPKA